MSRVKQLPLTSIDKFINWLLDNRDNIDQYIFSVTLKNGEDHAFYEAYSYREALGLGMMGIDALQVTDSNGDFICKERK